MTQMQMQILKGRPLPDGRHRVGKYPFLEMEVGDCFMLEDQTSIGVNRCRSAANFRGRKGLKFSVRKDGDGKYYCWRVG